MVASSETRMTWIVFTEGRLRQHRGEGREPLRWILVFMALKFIGLLIHRFFGYIQCSIVNIFTFWLTLL